MANIENIINYIVQNEYINSQIEIELDAKIRKDLIISKEYLDTKNLYTINYIVIKYLFHFISNPRQKIIIRVGTHNDIKIITWKIESSIPNIIPSFISCFLNKKLDGTNGFIKNNPNGFSAYFPKRWSSM